MKSLYLLLLIAFSIIVGLGGCSRDDQYNSLTTPVPPTNLGKANNSLPDLVITEVTLDTDQMRYICVFENAGTAPGYLNGVSIQGFYSQDQEYQSGQDHPACIIRVNAVIQLRDHIHK